MFPSDEPHVSVPQRYLEDLERRVAKAKSQQKAQAEQTINTFEGPTAGASSAEKSKDDAFVGLAAGSASIGHAELSRNASHGLHALGSYARHTN